MQPFNSKQQPFLGAHLSSARGFMRMGSDALSIDAGSFQFFLRNPRGNKAKPLDEDDMLALSQLLEQHGFAQVIAHAPYTMNACSRDAGLRELSAAMLAEDLSRMQYLPGNLYNLHPGSHSGQGVQAAIPLIAQMINSVLKPGHKTTLLLETMSGKGSEIGESFEQLQQILQLVQLPQKVGVCFDTCHMWDAGYDIVNNLEGVLAEFDSLIGLEKLHAVHINDSKNPCGSKKDRHAAIGEGCIGLKAICRIIRHPKLCHLPFVLETPHDIAGHKQEIALLRSLLQTD